jgi:methionyl-tRNA formyltransferase
MRIAFLGTPDFAVVSLAALLEAGHDIACVYSQPPAPRGRGQALKPSPVQAFAEQHGLMVRTPKSMKSEEEIAAFQALDLDLAVVVAFGQILKAGILDAPRLGCFNLHGSLLPRWRGAAPIQRAVMAGDELTGVQVMRMSLGLDEGAVLATVTTRIGQYDTAGTVHDRLAWLGARLLVDTLPRIESGEAVETPQSETGVTYARKITAAEARIDWSSPAEEIDRQIRGLSPFPGAWFEAPSSRGPTRVKALMSRVEDEAGAPGTALDDSLLIACGDGAAVRLLELQREGRGRQESGEFVRGFPVAAGTVLA